MKVLAARPSRLVCWHALSAYVCPDYRLLDDKRAEGPLPPSLPVGFPEALTDGHADHDSQDLSAGTNTASADTLRTARQLGG